MRISIAHTWDGQPLDVAERVSLDLAWVERHLIIEVDAPLGLDPVPPGPPGPLWKLWEHEVVELFLLGPNEEYTEVELGPHGHHLVLRLNGVRTIVAQELPMEFQVTRREGRWQGRASLSREWIPKTIVGFNAYAIRGTGEQRRYMAHSPVPGQAPDFHRISLFPPWPKALR